MKILLIAYDSGMYIHTFPIGLAYIAAVLRKEGFEVELYNQDVQHYPEKHLQDYLDKNHFDVVGVGVIGGYYQYRKLLRISEAVNRSKHRPFYVIAGHGPSPEPDYFLRKTQADAVVIGEGEVTIIELLKAVAGKKSLSTVKGIAYRQQGKTIINERRDLIQDIDAIPMPAYDIFPIKYYRLLREPNCTNTDFVLPMISGRGCTFKCTFCYRMDKGFRPRSAEGIIEEIRLLKTDYDISYVAFFDELLMSSVVRTEEICKAFIRKKLNIKWHCNGRLNYARPDLLKLMKQAGCVFINYGIESMDDGVLAKMNKALKVEQIVKGIEATLKAGVSPGFNILFGNIGDTKATLDKAVKFLLDYDDGAQLRTIRPVTPYPGSPLYYHAIETGLLKDCEDFYENKHKNSDLISVNFTRIPDRDLHAMLFEANKRLISNYFAKKTGQALEEARKLYLENNADFRGFRQT